MAERTFGTLYPTKNRITLDAGLSTKFPRANILDTESPDCLNVVFGAGAVETRGGTTKVNTGSVGSFVCDGLYTRRQSNGIETMVAFAGGKMWAFDGVNTFTTITSADSAFTAGMRIGQAQYQDYMFLGNGNGSPHKYDGTYFTRHGVPAPNSAPTASSIATGVLTGGYRYKVTYVNSALVEGDANTATATFTAASATIRLASLPVAPQSFGVASRRIYRTEVGGVTFKRLTEIADNSTTTYNDNNADSALGIDAPTDNGEPPNWNVAVHHQGRVWFNDVDNVGFIWYSEIGNPFVVESTSFLRVGDATSDTVKSLHIHQNSILVACENSIWLIYLASADPNDWSIIRIKSQFGTLSPYGLVTVGESVIFPATERGAFVGFGQIKGDAVAPDVTLTTEGAAGSELISQRIEPEMFSIKQDADLWKRISAVVWKNRAWFSVPHQDASVRNDRIYVFDFSIEQISKDNRPAWSPFSGITAEQFTVYNKKLYYSSSIADGFIHEADTDSYNDDGVAIDSYAWTKEFAGYSKDTHFIKDFRQLQALVENSGSWYMDLTVRTDSDRGEGDIYRFSLDAGGTLWGTMIWGTDLWGGGAQQQDISQFLGSLKGRRIQFKFSNENTVGQHFKVHNFAFTYNVRGSR